MLRSRVFDLDNAPTVDRHVVGPARRARNHRRCRTPDHVAWTGSVELHSIWQEVRRLILHRNTESIEVHSHRGIIEVEWRRCGIPAPTPA